MAETALRKGLTVLAGMAVAVAFVGWMLVLVLNTGSGLEEVVAAPPVTTADKDSETVGGTEEDAATATIVADGAAVATDDLGDASSERYPYVEDREALPLPEMGIASTAFSWQQSELLQVAGGEIWMNQLVEVDGTLWAVGGGYDATTDREQSLVFTSTDGVNWQRQELPAPLAGAGQVMFTVTDSGVVAVVNGYDEETASPILEVVVSVDGNAWTESDLSSLIGADEHMWVSQVAGGDGVLLMAGATENVPQRAWEPRVITIEHDGYVVELDEETWSYVVTEAATGTVVSSGSQEELWSRAEDEGIGVYDPVLGEMAISLGWEALERAGTEAYEAVAWGAPMVVEVTSGDRTMTLNEFSGALTVTDASGAVLFEGSEEDLWQGPPPTFKDGDEVVLVVPWDVWNAAHQAAYPENLLEPYFATPFLVRSVDGGVTWTEVDIEAVAGRGFYFQSLLRGPGGFLAIGSIEAAYEPGLVGEPEVQQAPTVLSSPDGLAWTIVDTNLEAGAWLNSVTATDAGYTAVLGDENGSQVMASADGVIWAKVLSEEDLGLEFGHVWFDRVATGGLGTFVSGTYDGWVEPEITATTISRDGRTLTIDGPEYTVTDDATGVVLFSYDEAELGYYGEEHLAITSTSNFKWGQGGVVMFNEDGTVVFAASHREFEQAMSAVWEESSVYYESEQVLLYLDGGEWSRVDLPDGLGRHTWFGGMVVTDASVVLVATSETVSEQDFSISNVALVGVPG